MRFAHSSPKFRSTIHAVTFVGQKVGCNHPGEALGANLSPSETALVGGIHLLISRTS
jgi:hypothetical protein